MAPLRRYPVGVQDFEKLRTEGFVYVDKTECIYDLTNHYGDAIFLGRPRRFGKSLLCSTLKYYFLGRKDLFEGLAIDSLEKEWTEYPVLHFDMSLCKNDDPKGVETSLSLLLNNMEEKFGIDGTGLGYGDRLQRLIFTAHERTGQRAVLMFDEYDSPVLNVIDSQEKVDAIRSIFNSFYSPVKALGEHIRFLFITGVTKFSQMSIFSTINHLNNISMVEKWEGLCGITAQELEQNFEVDIAMMAQKFRITPQEMAQRLRDRYDGYHFGSGMVDVYNPFSIIKAFANEMLDDYWFSSGTPAALIKILDKYNFQLADIENTKLFKRAFDQPFDNMETAIPILYQSGYLTIKDYNFEENIYTLGIPNQEVHSGLYSTLMPRYLSKDLNKNESLLMAVKRAIIADDIDAALTAAQSYLAALPYDLSNKTERDFETLLRVMFDCIGIETMTEVRNARGRCDVVMKSRSTIYVIELKISTTATVDEALAQINEKDYLIPYWNDPRRKVKVGVTVNPDTRTIDQWKVEE